VTRPTLPIDLQTIFDRCAAHLMVQGRPSIRPPTEPFGRPRCAYRGEGGTRCAVGVFIPDELYSPELEGFDAEHVLSACGLISEREQRGSDRLELLGHLQTLHDDAILHADDPALVRRLWARGLRRIADDFGLCVPPAVLAYEGEHQ
jgi:hypothetical protein